jgi:adenylate cyclase
VLPFLSMSSDPEQEYFSDGITEDLLARLSRIPDLRVISRTSVMRYKGTDVPIPEIAREVGVRYVLEGSVRREGARVRIVAQLIDSATDGHVWAETYDRELPGIFDIQSEIADRIARALELRISPADRARLAMRSPANLTAYDLLLRGREYLGRPGETDLRKYPLAIGFFRQAMEADPGYARAVAALSEAYRRNGGLPLVPVRRDSMLVYARRAVELDPDLPEAATEMGFAYLFAGEGEPAAAEFRRALGLDPNQADALDGLARLAAMGGRLDDAVRWQRRAVAVDPLSPERLVRLGTYWLDLGDDTRAEDAFRRAAAVAPDHPEAAFLLAEIHDLRGDRELAESRMRALMELAPHHPGAHYAMGKYLARHGRYDAAAAVLEESPAATTPAVLVFRALLALRLGNEERAAELVREPARMLADWEAAGLSVPPWGKVSIAVIRSDYDAAVAGIRRHWRTGLRWLEDPVRSGLYWIDREPYLYGLRSDPAFRELLGEIRAELDSVRARLGDDGSPAGPGL